MTNSIPDWENYWSPSDLSTGISSRFATQIELNKTARRFRYYYSDIQFPHEAIVRFVEKLEDTSFIKDKNITGELVAARNYDIYCAYIEIDGITDEYKNFFEGKITEPQFFARLFKIYLNPSLSSNGRIPIKDEIISVSYGVPRDFTTVKFAGFPSDHPEFDPDLQLYVKTEKKTAKSAFNEGP